MSGGKDAFGNQLVELLFAVPERFAKLVLPVGPLQRAPGGRELNRRLQLALALLPISAFTVLRFIRRRRLLFSSPLWLNT